MHYHNAPESCCRIAITHNSLISEGRRICVICMLFSSSGRNKNTGNSEEHLNSINLIVADDWWSTSSYLTIAFGFGRIFLFKCTWFINSWKGIIQALMIILIIVSYIYLLMLLLPDMCSTVSSCLEPLMVEISLGQIWLEQWDLWQQSPSNKGRLLSPTVPKKFLFQCNWWLNLLRVVVCPVKKWWHQFPSSQQQQLLAPLLKLSVAVHSASAWLS